MKARKLLLINLILLFCILPLACKKLSNYSPTVVVGRVTNLATGKGIPNALSLVKRMEELVQENYFSLIKPTNQF
jgi:hypothetical protein